MRTVLGFVALLMFSLSLPAAAQSSDLRDARLVGTWVNEDNYNSEGGAGFAFQSTVMVMQLGADGSVVQTTRTVSGSNAEASPCCAKTAEKSTSTDIGAAEVSVGGACTVTSTR